MLLIVLKGENYRVVRWMELKVEVEPELVEPIVDLFQRYGKQSPVVEETGGFNPDDDESPPEDAPVITAI